MNPQHAKSIMLAGAIVFGLGLVLYFFHDKLRWIGRLPGDIRIEKGNTRLYFPLTTMIIFSILLSCIAWICRKI